MAIFKLVQQIDEEELEKEEGVIEEPFGEEGEFPEEEEFSEELGEEEFFEEEEVPEEEEEA